MTETDVCNMALSHIGEGRITDINDDNETARLCRQYYDHSRTLILRQFPWGFARRIERLAKVDTFTPTGGYEHTYLYPENCLYVYRILDTEYVENKQRYLAIYKDLYSYDVFNIDNNTKVISTDVPNAYCDYIYNVTDPDLYEPLFMEALTRKLASDLAMPLVGNPDYYTFQFKIYQSALLEAKNITARERKYEVQPPVGYVMARRD